MKDILTNTHIVQKDNLITASYLDHNLYKSLLVNPVEYIGGESSIYTDDFNKVYEVIPHGFVQEYTPPEIFCNKYIIDSKLLISEDMLRDELFIPAVDFSLIDRWGEIKDLRDKWDTVYVYLKSGFNWSDILYEFRDIVTNLRLIIDERYLSQANGNEAFIGVDTFKIPMLITSAFDKIEVEIQLMDVNTLIKKDEVNYRLDFDLLNKVKLKYTGKKKSKQYSWVDIIDSLKDVTPNIFMYDSEYETIPIRYNTLDTFDTDKGTIIISNNHTNKLTFNPIVDILFDNISIYRDAYKIMKGGK